MTSVKVMINQIQCKRLAAIGIVLVTALVSFGLGLKERKNQNEYPTPLGLKLVAKYEPLHLYIYADTDSTNKYPDYLICEGNNDLLYRENVESNRIETTHFENGYSVLVTRRDMKGNISRRTVFYQNSSGETQYTYTDTNGDGLWDFFLDYTNRMYYVRSNLCWIRR